MVLGGVGIHGRTYLKNILHDSFKDSIEEDSETRKSSSTELDDILVPSITGRR